MLATMLRRSIFVVGALTIAMSLFSTGAAVSAQAEPGPSPSTPPRAKQEQDKRDAPPSESPPPKPELPKLPPAKKDALQELIERMSKQATTPEEAERILRERARERSEAERAAAKQEPGSIKNIEQALDRNAQTKEAGPQDDGSARFLPNPFLGTWAVTRISRPRAGLAQGRGYVIFTPSFMSMHLFMGGGQSDPQWQTSMRRYWVQGPLFVTASILGIQNSADGESILLEEAGRRESRRFQFLAPDLLRISQAHNAYIDLRRVETFGPGR